MTGSVSVMMESGTSEEELESGTSSEDELESGTSSEEEDGSPRGRRQQRRRLVMQLVRGSSFFFTAADHEDVASHGMIMDPQVWSRLPDEIMWEVLLLVPVSKHFQLQLVSRTWRQVLTSAHFRNRVIAAIAAAGAGGSRRMGAAAAATRSVALVSSADEDSTMSGSSDMESRRTVGGSSLTKAVEIDLRGLVPDWFLEPDSCSVVSAGDGLVCVSSDSEYHHFANRVQPPRDWWKVAAQEWEPCKPWVNRYCVLNPLTRTCVVLPPVPFRAADVCYPPVVTGTDGPGGAVTVAISFWCSRSKELATYRSGGGGAAAAAGQGWVVVHLPDAGRAGPPVDALLGGQRYHYDQDEDLVHVMAAEDGSDCGQVAVGQVAVEEEEEGSSSLKLPASMTDVRGHVWKRLHPYKQQSVVVAHRGAIYLLSYVVHACYPRYGSGCDPGYDPGCGVRRLERAGASAHVNGGRHVHAYGRVDWEAVSLLDFSVLDGLTDHWYRHVMWCNPNVFKLGASYRVRELVCVPLEAETRVGLYESKTCDWLVGFNLDTGKWEQVHHDVIEHCKGNCKWEQVHHDELQCNVAARGKAMELRPDLFLAP